jgi:VWFA-related protein
MRRKVPALALVFGLLGFTGLPLRAQVGAETRSIAVKPGDTLNINDDHGKIRIRPWVGTAVEVKITKTSRGQVRMSSSGVIFRRSGDSVILHAFFSGLPGEAVDFEIRAPKFMNVTISGANPDIDIGGIHGTVRIQDSAGLIIAEDLISSVSLVTEKGDVIYRANVQPQGDVRLESASGNVYCELEERLNLRGRLHAGGTVTWNMEPALRAASLEKQLGTLGPQLYAGSLKGNVEVRLKGVPGETQAAASSQAVVAREAARRSPKPLPETTQSAEPAPVAPRPPQEVRREPPAAGGEQPAAPAGAYSLKVNVDSVFLNVSVLDRNTNRSIVGLQKDDFQVYEDGVLQQVEQLLPSEAPFNLLLLLDVSGSTQSYLPLMKEAAIDFTRQIKANDQIAIATFNSYVQLIENFTNDRAAAARAIQMIQSGGGTAFYDALMTCIDQHMRGLEGRSAIVVFTDGVDNQLYGNRADGSRTTFDQLYRRVQEIDPIIYTIFLDTEGQLPTVTRGPTPTTTGEVIDILGGILQGGRYPGPYPDPRRYPAPNPYPTPNPYPGRQGERAAYELAREQLLTIAEQTGGRMYTPRRIEELSRVYSEIADDLRIQYQLGYNSTNRARDGRWREIRVQVKNHTGAVVRTRKGYYARKETSP